MTRDRIRRLAAWRTSVWLQVRLTSFRSAVADSISTGDYLLSLTTQPDDYGNDVASARAVELSTAPTRVVGTIEYPGDVDMFQFVATTRATLTLEQTMSPGVPRHLHSEHSTLLVPILVAPRPPRRVANPAG